MVVFEFNLNRELTLKIELRKNIIMLEEFIRRYFKIIKAR